MKRAISLFLALMMLIALAACGGGSQSTNEPTPTQAADKTPETKPAATEAPAKLEPTPEPTPEPIPEIKAIPVSIGDKIENSNFIMTFDSFEILPKFSYKTSEHSSTSLYVEDGYQIALLRGHFENTSTSVIQDSCFSYVFTVNDSFVKDAYDVRFNFMRDKYFEIDPYTDYDYCLYINIPEKLAEKFEKAVVKIGFNDDMSIPATVWNPDGTKTIETDNQYEFTWGVSGAAAPSQGAPEKQNNNNQTLDLKNTNAVGDNAEITFITAFSTDLLEPPIVSGVHMTYSPADGKTYLVLSADIKNTSSTAAAVDKLIGASISSKGNDTQYKAAFFGITEGGSKIENRPSIDALATKTVYMAFAVPKGSESETYDLLIVDGNNHSYSASFSIKQFEDEKPTISIGDTISDDTVEIKIEDVYYTKSLYPPKPSSYYHYYEAENGKTYLVVKVTAKNLKGTDLKYDSIAGVSCVYNEKYNYSAFCVLEKDGGGDLNGYPSQYAISPLDTGKCYYLCEVPDEVQNGPTIVTIYAIGKYHSLKAS